jgi:hypothetical protein
MCWESVDPVLKVSGRGMHELGWRSRNARENEQGHLDHPQTAHVSQAAHSLETSWREG